MEADLDCSVRPPHRQDLCVRSGRGLSRSACLRLRLEGQQTGTQRLGCSALGRVLHQSCDVKRSCPSMRQHHNHKLHSQLPRKPLPTATAHPIISAKLQKVVALQCLPFRFNAPCSTNRQLILVKNDRKPTKQEM
jgi:hypothetical protein